MMQVLGIVNVTPDSFSDGGHHATVDLAVAHGERLLTEGADMLDVGGESTRPGAADVAPEEEAARVIPVVARLVRAGVRVSIDTRRADVAARALDLGAWMVNDVSGGADPAMFGTVARAGCAFTLMHMRGVPSTMQAHAHYDDVCDEVWGELAARVAAAVAAGVDPSRIVWDPGIGFAKGTEHNLALLRDLPLRTRGRAVMVGASRKRFIGELTGQAVAAERVEGSLAVALHAAASGAAWVRVHDVAATVRALTVWRAIA
jgi:dihydropteroate synthase